MKSSNKKGFTLIELIMTIIVAGIVAIPLSITIFQYVQSAFFSQDLTFCNNLLRLELGKINNLRYGSITDYSEANYQGYGYDLDRTVSEIASGSNRLKSVTVTLSAAGSVTPIASAITYIANNSAYDIGGAY